MAKKDAVIVEAPVNEEFVTEVIEEVVTEEVVSAPVISDVIAQVAAKAATAEAARLAAVEAKEAAKKAKEEEKAAKKAAKEAGVKIKAEKALAIIQNGVARPRANSACGKIWAYCDAISKEMKQHAPIAAVLEVSKVHTENGVVSPFHPTTVRCQFAKWRKFNGVVAVKAEKAVEPVVIDEAVIVEDTIVEDTFGVEDVVV